MNRNFYKVNIEYLKLSLRLVSELSNEIFIIYDRKKSKIKSVVNNGDDLIKDLLDGENPLTIKEYKQHELMEFCSIIISDTNKFKTINKKYTVYKYNILQKQYLNKIKNNKPLNSYLTFFEILKKDKKVKHYLRKNKLKKVLNESNKNNKI